MRFFNAVIAGLCVISGAIFTGYRPDNGTFIISIVVFFSVLGGNGINDFFDRRIDKINAPERPIPKGKIKAFNMLFISIIYFLLAFFISIFMGGKYILITSIAITFLILYTPFLKPFPFLGNIFIALISAFTFVLGAITIGCYRLIFFPFLFAFFLHLPREILKDVEDIEGDKKNSLKTLPIVVGVRKSFRFSLIPLFILFVLTIISLFYLNNFYKVAMVLLFDIPLIYFTLVSIRFFRDFKSASRYLQRRLKFLMVSGLVVITIGGIC